MELGDGAKDATDDTDNDAENNIDEPGNGLPAQPYDQAVNQKKIGRRRKRRRRKRKQEKENVNLSIVLTNCKGYSSKKESIEKDIIEKKAPDVLLINETLLTAQRKIKSKDYISFVKNREEKVTKGGGVGGGGGIATLIANHLRQNTVKAGEGSDGDEYLITRLNHVRPTLNIVNIYGENESRAHWSLKAKGCFPKSLNGRLHSEKKVLTRSSIWCIWQQYSLEETSIQWVLLFTIGIVQNICNFGYIVFLSCMLMA